MATLGEAVRKYAESKGATVKQGATIGESVRALAKHVGVPADGTVSEIIEAINEEEAEDSGLLIKAVGFFNELSQEAISEYMIENSEAVMSAFGVTKEDEASNIATAIYDKLQGGDTVSVNMSDGGILHISGHFDEGGTDEWNIVVKYDVPEGGTNRCFPEGSKYVVKGGSVTLTANPAEITNTEKYDMALCVYGYKVDIAGVTVTDGEDTFTLNVAGLMKPADYSKPCIIDPNGATFTISVHDFVFPPADAEGEVKVDSEPIAWAEIVAEL